MIVVSSVILPINVHKQKKEAFTSTTAVGMAYLRYSGVIVGLLSAKEYRAELYQ